MVQTKRNQEKAVVTKICFYDSAKTEWKIKMCVMESKCSVAKMIKMRGNNLMLTSKLHFLLNISDPCSWIFHETSLTGILMRWWKWGARTLCQLQNCTFYQIPWLLFDWFSWDFYNRHSLMRLFKNHLYLEDPLHHPLLSTFNLYIHSHTYICHAGVLFNNFL